ncbi:Macrophage colony-stimulating factor 1 receptor [Collariella sp. IMI 366227]|nr:Macrophage colony-stimulating factor 1 receptor [Collariella sp. IMI 366227]
MSSGGFFSGNGAEFHPSIFSLLYFNRIFSSIVSWGIRTYTWHQHGLYIDIQALQVSLLAGRIFFTGLRCHGNNETFLVQNGHITWAYWLRRVRQADVGKVQGGGQDAGAAAGEIPPKLPCRVKVSLRGLEWFVYNRSPAYDSILAGLSASADAQQESDSGRGGPGATAPAPPAPLRRRRSGRQEAPRSSSPARFSVKGERQGVSGSENERMVEPNRAPSLRSSGSDNNQAEDSSAQAGDADLPMLLQLLPIYLKCDRAAIVMGNENTKAILIVKTDSFSGEIDASETQTPDPFRQLFRFKFKHPVIEMKENMDFKEEQADRAEKPSGRAPNINGAEPPAWGINLSVNGGSINYGPWADRLRADLQRTFVPGLCKDAVPARPLAPGADRVPTQFKFFMELTDATTIRVPVREESKNWRWKGKEPAPRKAQTYDTRKARRSKKSDQPGDVHQRPYGWLDIGVPANATVSYSMDMTASAAGYTNTLDVDLPSTEISSSINHELLWKSERLKVSCDLSTPLGWNALRQWRFAIASDDLELYILRDHVFLLIDLVNDWTSGPPTEYLVFTPFKYYVNLRLENVKLFLNLNDANIVNNPTDLDDNTYLIITSPLLTSDSCIPVDTYRPSKNSIPFDIKAETATIDLHVPPWNTQAPFLVSKEVGRLENLVVDGAYHYNATTSPANTDTLVLSVAGQSPVATVHGFIIRYCLKVKDNYFGDDIHFKTLEEYQDMLRSKESDPDAEPANKPPPKKSNDLDVMLSIRADDPKVLLPANLYSSKRHIQIDTASLSVDLRFTNYYMDLDLTVAPLNLSLGSTESGAETPMSATSSTQLFIDGINVYGHRLFGLPPTEPTYMCNWDLSLGVLTGQCTTEFLATLVSAGKAFGFTFDDDENALVPFSSVVVYDVTFLRVFVHSVRLWIHVEDAAFLLSTGAIDVNYNDWARSHYSKRANISIPDIKLSCLNAELASRHKARSQHAVEPDALVQTSIRVAIIGRKANFSKERRLQQELVRKHDQRTHRTPFLVLPELLNDRFTPELVDPPAQRYRGRQNAIGLWYESEEVTRPAAQVVVLVHWQFSAEQRSKTF